MTSTVKKPKKATTKKKKKGESCPKTVLLAPIRLQQEDAFLLNNAKALIDEHQSRRLLNVKQDHITIADKYDWRREAGHLSARGSNKRSGDKTPPPPPNYVPVAQPTTALQHPSDFKANAHLISDSRRPGSSSPCFKCKRSSHWSADCRQPLSTGKTSGR